MTERAAALPHTATPPVDAPAAQPVDAPASPPPPPAASDATHRAPDAVETAFREGTIRIPLSGEGAYAERVAVVVGELVITKLPVYERHVVHGTVRIEHVSAEERSAEHVVPDQADATTLRRAA